MGLDKLVWGETLLRLSANASASASAVGEQEHVPSQNINLMDLLLRFLKPLQDLAMYLDWGTYDYMDNFIFILRHREDVSVVQMNEWLCEYMNEWTNVWIYDWGERFGALQRMPSSSFIRSIFISISWIFSHYCNELMTSNQQIRICIFSQLCWSLRRCVGFKL